MVMRGGLGIVLEDVRMKLFVRSISRLVGLLVVGLWGVMGRYFGLMVALHGPLTQQLTQRIVFFSRSIW